MTTVISTEEPADTVSLAEALLARHNERKAELDTREESMNQITRSGMRLVQHGHYANSEVEKSIIDCGAIFSCVSQD